MSEYFLSLGRDDQREVLEIASAAMGRSAHLLEKDVWVVLALSALYAEGSPLANAPTGQARDALAEDYALMVADDVMVGKALAFDDLMRACSTLEQQINSV
ncbi:MAG: hypothetical protein AABY68_04115 [Pseudomonadota bacterium]